MASENAKRGASTKNLKPGQSVRSVRHSAPAPPSRSGLSVRSPGPPRSVRSELSVRPSAPAHSVRSELSVRPSARAHSVRSELSVGSAASARPAPSKQSVPHAAPAPPAVPPAPEPPAPSERSSLTKTYTAHQRPLEQYLAMTKKMKNAAKKRAEGRAKVPHRYRDSIKRFFFSPTGMLKILRLGIIIGALACFIHVQAHESFIAITVLETCIVIFFILTYMIALHHLLTCLHWPLLDLINSIITAVFLFIVAILAMQEKNRRKLFYTGGCLCLAAAIVCLFDAFVVTKRMRTAVKSFLQIKVAQKSDPKPGHSQMHLSSSHPSKPTSY